MNKNVFLFIVLTVVCASHAFNGSRSDLLYAEYNKQVVQELQKNLQTINQELQNTIRDCTQLLDSLRSHKK